jgi:hypothetical protein
MDELFTVTDSEVVAWSVLLLLPVLLALWEVLLVWSGMVVRSV